MDIMTKQSDEQCRETRWSANKKTDAVLRLLRGERLDELSRELGWRRIGWRRGAMSSWPAARTA